MKPSSTQYLIGAVFQAGVAYLFWTHRHPILAYIAATGAAVSLIEAAGPAASTPAPVPADVLRSLGTAVVNPNDGMIR